MYPPAPSSATSLVQANISPDSPGRSPRAAAGPTQRRFRQRTELTRERDVIRHLVPWEETYKPKSLRTSVSDGNAGDDKPSLETCPDTALAAFAQLCVLRLRARRCLISLITTDTEYVLADIAKRTALQYDAVAEDPRDRTWIGTCSFPRREGINHDAVDEWRKARRTRDPPQEIDYYYSEGVSQHWSLISDARQKPDLQKTELLQKGPWIRFCASVPLRGAQGSVIGAITVLDDKPRYGLSASEMAFLEDISDTTVEHLHSTIVRSQRQRGERLIQALGTFNNGQASLRDWWLGQDDARVLGTGRHAAKGGDDDRQARVDAEFGVQRNVSDDSAERSSSPKVASSQRNYFGPTGVKEGEPKTSKDNSPTDGRSEAGTEPLKGSARPRRSRSEDHRVDLATSSAGAYARASNLLREAISLDGAVFADASSATSRHQQDHPDQGDDDEILVNPTNSEIVQPRVSDTESSDSGVEGQKMCNIQAFSTRNRSSLKGFTPGPQHFPMPEHHLQRLIKRYPEGAIFHFDRHGRSFVSSDEGSDPSSNEDLDVERKRRSKDARLLSKAISGARTVALFPLWDDSIDRWRSCIIVWSTSGDRYFDQQEDLTYLKAFGHSLVAELSRLESLATDKAKGTFISSISHETRSPLHGIMAGVEFLQESELTFFQEEMVHAISMAGRTLLDTMNHILDYSKISNYSRAQRRTSHRGTGKENRLHPASSKTSPDAMGDSDVTDLARLTEAVVETTVAAHRSQYQTPLSPVSPRPIVGDFMQHEPLSAATPSWQPSEVGVLLNIDYLKNWVVKMQPGVWTRILTNLLGNALKYTAEGHISVRLTMGSSNGQENFLTAPVELIIEDTGIGISEAFLSHGVFMPFKQEDTHSTGIGLGLSIVHQLARDMGATLNLKSKRGSGTKVTLNFPANFASGKSIVKDPALAVDALPEGLNVNQFHLLALKPNDESDMPFDEQGVGDSVLELAGEWLHCDTRQGPSIARIKGKTICAITEEQFDTLEAKSPEAFAALLNQGSKVHSYLLVLGRSIQSLTFSPRTSMAGITPVFVHQPIGPRKLLRAIASDRSSTSHGDRIRRANSLTPETVLDMISNTPGSKPPFPLDTGHGSTQDRIDASRRYPQARSSDAKEYTLPTRDSKSHPGPSVTPNPLLPPTPGALGHPTENNDDDDDNDDTVLLVEDNEVNIKLLVALMAKLKLPFHCAKDGREALDMYRAHPGTYFLVLMDMSMPIMDGFTATARIREYEKRHGLKRTAIVALTGATTEESRSRALDCGVDEYYAKPVRMNELRGLVGRIKGE